MFFHVKQRKKDAKLRPFRVLLLWLYKYNTFEGEKQMLINFSLELHISKLCVNSILLATNLRANITMYPALPVKLQKLFLCRILEP